MAETSPQELSLDELKSWVQQLCNQFQNKQLVLLTGTLGAGKTELVKQILHELGCEEVSSPTYGLIHEYAVSGRKNVFHIDLYRIEGEEDLESSGFWDLFENSEGLIFVEWADRCDRSHFPMHWPTLEIQIEASADSNKRRYHVTTH